MLTETDFSVQNRISNDLGMVGNQRLIGDTAFSRLNLERVQSRFTI